MFEEKTRMKRSPRIGFVVATLALWLIGLVVFNSFAIGVASSVSEVHSAVSVSHKGFVYAEGDRLMHPVHHEGSGHLLSLRLRLDKHDGLGLE